MQKGKKKTRHDLKTGRNNEYATEYGIILDKRASHVVKLQLDPTQYQNIPGNGLFFARERAIITRDLTEPIQINIDALFPIFKDLTKTDILVYSCFLTYMQDNNTAIYIPVHEIQSLTGVQVGTIRDCLKVLKRAGLLIPAPPIKSNNPSASNGYYLINPVFAWRGDRSKFFNLEKLEAVEPIPERQPKQYPTRKKKTRMNP